MSSPHEPFSGLAAGYVLGALDDQDLARFQTHLAQGCDECERDLVGFGDALTQATADLRETPPAHVKRDLLTRIARGDDRVAPLRVEDRSRGVEPGDRRRNRVARRTQGPSRSWQAVRWLASVAVVSAVIAAVVAGLVSTRYEARLGQIARETAAVRAQLADQRQLTGLLRDPSAWLVRLDGLDPSPYAQGRMIWRDATGGIFVAWGLPGAPEGKIYELWAITDGKPVPAGLFNVDAEGNVSLELKPLPGVTKVDMFAVTLEPAGGVPAPTGAMYLASKG